LIVVAEARRRDFLNTLNAKDLDSVYKQISRAIEEHRQQVKAQ